MVTSGVGAQWLGQGWERDYFVFPFAPVEFYIASKQRLSQKHLNI